MERENYLKFRKLTDRFFKKLKEKGLKISYCEIDKNYPDIFFRFSSRGLRKYSVGIWACGKWSDYYDVEKNSYISIFLIHDWRRDKFRPSSSDIEFIAYPDEHYDTYIDIIIKLLIRMKNKPIDTYYEIDQHPRFKNHVLNYIHSWWIINSIEIRDKFKYTICPIILFGILRFISFFDPRVKKVKVFDEKYTIPRYTFSFLATIKCSESEKSFKRFYLLYDKFPSWINRKFKFGDAMFNVADYDETMSEDEIRARLFKGVVVELKRL